MIRKQSFHRNENHKNGLLLQVQYIAAGPAGDVLRSRFIFASFDKNGERLAVVDHRYLVSIIDFSQNKYWHLKTLTSCTLLSFCQNSDDLLVGFSSGNLAIFDTGLGVEIAQLKGHKKPPHLFSFSSNGLLCLTASSTEGIIWDMKSKSPAHCLVLQPETSITQVLFMPVSNNILACFQDNVIHVWQLDTFDCVRQVVPDAWEGRQICTISFTRNGRAMVLGGECLQLVVFMMDDWSAQKIIEFPESFRGVRKVEFIADLFDGGANKMLAVLGINGDMCFIDLESGQSISKLVFSGVEDFTCSPSGKYLSCITASGDVKIFSLAKVLNNRKSQPAAEVAEESAEKPVPETEEGAARTKPFIRRKSPASAPNGRVSQLGEERTAGRMDIDEEPSSAELVNRTDVESRRKSKHVKKQSSSVRHSANQHLQHVNAKIDKAIDLGKVRRILNEFGKLPERYRLVIWRTVLRLPNNSGIYRSLVERGTHPAWVSLSQTYNITNKTILHTLQSVLSSLSYWCPAIAELPYMPHLVFPFVKNFHNNGLVCFEVVMTVIVNWCQHWFELLSFPPINVLAMIENVLGEADLNLLNTFYDAGITTKLYAWPLLSTAFSEVLSSNEWLRLWDHVLCNPPWFLILAVVSYNICCRTTLKTCSSEEDFEFFYHHQNPIDMDQLIRKTYELCENVSDTNHPQQFIRPFEPLPEGSYPVLSGLPSFIVDYKNQQRNAILRQEEELLREEHELLKLRLKVEEEYRDREMKSVQQARLRELEVCTRKAIAKEEERLHQKRRDLAALESEIRNHEHQLISKAQSQMEEQLSKQRCDRIAEMQQKLESKSKEVEFEQEALEREQRAQYSRLAALRRELHIRLEDVQENRGSANPPNSDPRLEQLLNQNERLTQKLYQMQSNNTAKQYASTRKTAGKLSELDRRNEEKDLQTAEEADKIQDYLLKSQQIVEGTKLDAKSQELRLEVDKMLKELEAAYLRRTRTAASERNSSSTLPKSTSSLCSGNGLCSSARITGAGTSGSSSARHRLRRREGSCHLPAMGTGFESFPPVRSEEFYKREQAAVNSAMKVRASLLSKYR